MLDLRRPRPASSLYAALTAPPLARITLATAMPSSLLLLRIAAAFRAASALVHPHVTTRGPARLSLASGRGVQLAVPDCISEPTQQPQPQPQPQPEPEPEPQPQPQPEPQLQPLNPPRSPARKRRHSVRHSTAELLALVVARDASEEHPLLAHVIPPSSNPPTSTNLSCEQHAVLLSRLFVFDALLREQLAVLDAPDQLVLFAPGLSAPAVERQPLPLPLSVFALNDAALAVPAAADAARIHSLLRDDLDYVHVDAALDGCVWDSALVLHGYNWQRKSMWVLNLDLTTFDQPALERHFRMIGTLASVDSVVLVVYLTPDFAANHSYVGEDVWKGTVPPFACDDPFAFAKSCGFQVSYATSLRDAAIKYGLPVALRKQLSNSVFADGVRFAIFTHSQRNLPPATPDVDSVSEVTPLSGFSATASAASATTSATPFNLVDHSAISEFEDYVSSDTRVLRFEIQISSIPRDLAQPELSVVLMGSEASFGCWEPRRAKKMYGNICADDAGVMTADLSMSVKAGDVEYKYAITNARHEIVAWEMGSNRVLRSLSAGGSSLPGNVQYIRDEWRC